MGKLHHNRLKFRYEGRTRDGRMFAVDEDLIAQWQLDDFKAANDGALLVGLFESSRWESQIGKNDHVFYIDPLLEQIREDEEAEMHKQREEQQIEARKAKREQIRAYILAHPHATDNRLIAQAIETTIHQVRRVRRELAAEEQPT